MWRKVNLYFHTLIHLKPWQILGRIVAKGKRSIGWNPLSDPPPSLNGSLNAHFPFPNHDPWNSNTKLQSGSFCFLDVTQHLGHPVDWDAAHMPLLWRFNLHYFHYLHLLNAEDQVALCKSWIENNPVGQGAGWHAYPTSLRIVNWCRTGFRDEDIQTSLYLQAAYLYRNLETYIYGNHLLENARALVIAGSFFSEQGEAPVWLHKGLELFRREISEQILPDGGHYERSPMYHALMLEALLDVINCLPEEHSQRQALSHTANRMADVLCSLTHPDGHLAMFNDTTLEIAPPPAVLLDYAQKLTGHIPQRKAMLPEMGYFIHIDIDLFLIIDGGAVGPNHLLAHAHADVFSYELSIKNQPIVVDTGVYEYQVGQMRNYVRSTMAHNTVCIDGIDQVECWEGFRVARRFAPHDVKISRTDDEYHFSGSFSGYSSLIGDSICHHRSIKVQPDSRRITITDEIEGRGMHCVESRIHLHPSVIVTPRKDHILLRNSEVNCRFYPGETPLRYEKGWYCPRFGFREQNDVLVLGGKSSLPSRLMYQISY